MHDPMAVCMNINRSKAIFPLLIHVTQPIYLNCSNSAWGFMVACSFVPCFVAPKVAFCSLERAPVVTEELHVEKRPSQQSV